MSVIIRDILDIDFHFCYTSVEKFDWNENREFQKFDSMQFDEQRVKSKVFDSSKHTIDRQ